MLAILNVLNAHSLPIFQPILMILVSKFMVHRALSDKTYLSLGLLSPLIFRLSKHILPFKLEIIHYCRHPASLKIRISEVQDFGNFTHENVVNNNCNWHLKGY